MKSFPESRVVIRVSLEKLQCFPWKKPIAGQCFPSLRLT